MKNKILVATAYLLAMPNSQTQLIHETLAPIMKKRQHIMKRLPIIFFVTLLIGQSFGQTIKNENSISNSITIKENSIEDFLLVSQYLSIKNDVESFKSSSLVIPDIDTIENTAIISLSDIFIVTKNSQMTAMISLHVYPKREFVTTIVSTNKRLPFPCNLSGDITENRANELIKEKYDSTAKIENGLLIFNNKKFQLIKSENIEKTVIELIQSEKINKYKPSVLMLISKNQLRNYILTETKKESGNLDYFTEISVKEYDGFQEISEDSKIKLAVALYKWGRVCHVLGMNTLEDTYAIYAEFKDRELNQYELEYIKKGFDKDLNK